jgi:DNA-binding XRE family transcriptional regulator
MQGVLKKIRATLRMTQSDLAEAIGISRGLWSVHEGKDVGDDHDVPPHIARSLIKLARLKGVPLTYEHIYDGKVLPEMVLVPVEQIIKRGRKPKPKRPPPKAKGQRRIVVDRAT